MAKNDDFTSNEKDRRHVTLRKDGFKKWFRIIFIPYYLKYILFSAALIALVTQAGIYLFSIPTADMTYYVALDAPMPSEDIASLQSRVAQTLSDNLRRDAIISTDTIYVYSSPYIYASFIGTLEKGDAVLYFVDDGIRKLLDEKGNTPFGTEAIREYTGRDEMFLPLSDSPALSGATDYTLYVAFARLRDGESAEKYAPYIKLLSAWFPSLGAAKNNQ